MLRELNVGGPPPGRMLTVVWRRRSRGRDFHIIGPGAGLLHFAGAIYGASAMVESGGWVAIHAVLSCEAFNSPSENRSGQQWAYAGMTKL